MFALCCHHCCSWDSYVGREFLENRGFTPYYFHILCCLSSWATCGSRIKTPTKCKTDILVDVSSEQRLASDSATEINESEENEKDGLEHAVVEETDEGSCIKYVYF